MTTTASSGPVPGEPKRTRRPALPLSDKACDAIRNAAEYTGLSQEVVKMGIAVRTLKTGAHSLDAFVALVCLDLAEEADKRRKETREALFAIPKAPQIAEEAKP